MAAIPLVIMAISISQTREQCSGMAVALGCSEAWVCKWRGRLANAKLDDQTTAIPVRRTIRPLPYNYTVNKVSRCIRRAFVPKPPGDESPG